MRKPDEYYVGEIIELTEGPFVTVACLSENASECPRANGCKTLPLWKEFNNTVRDFFYSKKLSDLI